MSRQPQLRLPTNATTSDGLRRVAEALAELDRLDCAVHACTIVSGRPSLLIEPPPGGLVGAVRMLQRGQGRREAVWIATVAGCRVEYSTGAYAEPAEAG